MIMEKHGVAIQFLSGWWFGTCFIVPYIGKIIIPTDELIFSRGVGQPPSSRKSSKIGIFRGSTTSSICEN